MRLKLRKKLKHLLLKLLKSHKIPDLDKFEWEGFSHSNTVIGVDEVGRGCLAGPVYAAACIINQEYAYTHYTDSKKISASKRDIYAAEIIENHQVSLGYATVKEIEDINILNASLLAMKRAILGLGVKSGYVLVDGNKPIPEMPDAFVQETLIKGDLRATPIAAASIVAKVTRDNLMVELSKKFPEYSLEKHKGYPTKQHKEAIIKHGATEIHRRTFAGVL